MCFTVLTYIQSFIFILKTIDLRNKMYLFWIKRPRFLFVRADLCVFQGEGGRVLEELLLPRVSDQAVGSAHGARSSAAGGREERGGEERSRSAQRDSLRLLQEH